MTVPDATCEVAVVGAGVVGCALAWQLARALGPDRVVLLEQAEREGTGISSRNSGVVHAGLYYTPGSVKARACVEGNARLWAWVERFGVGHRRTGKLVIATDEAELAALEQLASNALACGAEVELVDAGRARELEPELRGDLLAALWSPRSGIVDVHGFVRSLRVEAEREGASVLFGARVLGIAAAGSGWWIESTRGSLLADRVINAAGLHADAIAKMVGVERTIIPARGDYFRLRRPRPWRRLIYPVQVPGGASLGVHLTLELDGGCRLGPDLDWSTSKDDFSSEQGEAKRERFRIAASRLLGDLADEDLAYDGCGIRPKLVGRGVAAADFEVLEQPAGVRHYLGIESPGLTAALALSAAERSMFGRSAGLVLAAALMLACHDQPTFRELDLGVDVRLNAVESDRGDRSFVAVGAEGTVVRHEEDSIYRNGRLKGFEHRLQNWELGNEELRDVEANDSGMWFVVGDRGTIYIGHETPGPKDDDIEWVAQDSDIDANLHGVAYIQDDHGVTVFVVGDEVVATGDPSGELGMFDWTESPPPPGGWGRLRDVQAVTTIHWTDDDKSFEHAIQVVGEQGRMWTSDLGPAGWVAVDLDTDVNLVEIATDSVICGNHGTIVRCIDECWAERFVEFDFVACGDGWMIAGHRIFAYSKFVELRELDRLPWQPRAAAEHDFGLVVVGDEGRAGIRD